MHVLRHLFLVLSLIAVVGCYNKVRLTDPIVWQADDRHPIPEPQEETDGLFLMWDAVDKLIFYRVGQTLNLGRSVRKVGTWFGLADPVEAGNVNALDEVPNSTWFTNRHFFSRLSQEELARGITTGDGEPDTTEPWTVIGGKESLGSTPGFVIRDQKGDIYVVKFDPPLNPEMATASEVISSRFLYAAGYNVPENYLLYFDPKIIQVGESAKISGRYNVKRPMTEQDIALVLDRIPHLPDGTIRAAASKFLAGIPKGPFLYEGRRDDDVNDRIRHENRRELRGLRIIAAFLNHTDTKAGNALDMYDPETGYLTHHLIDFSSTLGADNADPQLPRYGNEYFADFGTMGRSWISLGAYVKPWEVPHTMQYPSVGYFESEYFDPARWRPTFPNPAFLRTTLRDAYWGAKIVASFSDDDIDTIVRTGRYSNPAAERYVADVLKVRRDKIARYYFSRVNPLDRFRLENSAQGDERLVFDDLAVAGGYTSRATTLYRYSIGCHVPWGQDPTLIADSIHARRWTIVQEPRIELATLVAGILSAGTCRAGERRPIVYTDIATSNNQGKDWSNTVSVYLNYDRDAKRFTLIGLDRET